MAIKFLRGIYKADQLKTTRPVGFKFPLGLKLSNTLETANSSTTATIGTFDILVVGGGGSSGIGGPGQSGGGGGGGVRFFTANSFSEMPEFKNPTFITGTTNFIPVVVGGTAGRSCLSSAFIACGGGTGGSGQWGSNNGEVGGSGGGGGRVVVAPASVNTCGTGGNGIVGQGCCGTNGGPGTNAGSGGAALCSLTAPNQCNCNGLTTSITGTSIRYSDGGNGGSTPLNGSAGTINRGNGGHGLGTIPGNGPFPAGGAGGSGIVAIRYCNPAAPTTALATGGDCICCTGGCIIHIFNSSGFLNISSSFSIN